MKCVNILAAGMLLIGQSLSGVVLAAPVTMSGDNVDFIFDDALLGLNGKAQVRGDTLYFMPIDFDAKSLNGQGYVLANETMNILVSAHDGWSFAGVNLLERGDYLLLGEGGKVHVTGQMRVFDVAKPLVDLTSGIVPLSALDQTGLSMVNWASNSAVDLSSMHGASMVNVTVENLLLASTTNPGTLAFIEKKWIGLSMDMDGLAHAATPVPEADAYAMLLAGLGLVGLAYRRSVRNRLK